MLGVNGVQPAIPSSGKSPETQNGRLDRDNGRSNVGLAVDTYSGSSASWHDTLTTPATGTACRCGSCPACAANVYATQGQSVNSEEPGNGEEQGAVERNDGSGSDDNRI